MKNRLILTVLLIIGLMTFSYVFHIFKQSIEASIAVNQITNSIISYSLIQRIIVSNFFVNIVKFGVFVLGIIIWYKPFKEYIV